MILSQTAPDAMLVVQFLVLPLVAGMWYSIVKRIDRLESKVDNMPSGELCRDRHKSTNARLVRLETVSFKEL